MIRDIINTYRQAFRMYIRQRTRPLSIEEAEEKRLFWAKTYMGLGFLILVSLTAHIYRTGENFKYRKDVPKDKAILDALILSGSTAKVAVYQGFKKVDEFKFTPSTETTEFKVEKIDSTTDSKA